MASVRSLMLVVLVVYCVYYFHDSGIKGVEASRTRHSYSKVTNVHIHNYNTGQHVHHGRRNRHTHW